MFAGTRSFSRPSTYPLILSASRDARRISLGSSLRTWIQLYDVGGVLAWVVAGAELVADHQGGDFGSSLLLGVADPAVRGWPGRAPDGLGGRSGCLVGLRRVTWSQSLTSRGRCIGGSVLRGVGLEPTSADTNDRRCPSCPSGYTAWATIVNAMTAAFAVTVDDLQVTAALRRLEARPAARASQAFSLSSLPPSSKSDGCLGIDAEEPPAASSAISIHCPGSASIVAPSSPSITGTRRP